MWLRILFIAFVSSSCFAKHYFIWDFDETLTKTHTYKATFKGDVSQEWIKSQVKPGAGEALKRILDGGQLVGIATFHVRPDVIRRFLHVMLPAEYVARIRIASRSASLFVNTDKNAYIRSLVREAELEGEKITGITFFENNPALINAFRRGFIDEYKDAEGCEGVLVRADPENYEHFMYAILKLDKILKRGD